MSSDVSREMRKSVADRAEHRCEYCLVHEEDLFFSCEVDHIISRKHGGLTILENVADACLRCNRFKGTDLGSVDLRTGFYFRFDHPRLDLWADHFSLEGARILARTEIGEVTSRIFSLNSEARLMERETLRLAGRYPCDAAMTKMNRRSSE